MAAENGWNEAKVRLSYEYHFGHNGIKKDTQKAIYWYQKVVVHHCSCLEIMI